MLNYQMIDNAIKRHYKVSELKSMLKIDDDTEIIKEIFKYAKILIRNYYRTKDMNINDNISQICNYLIHFINKNHLNIELIMNSYNDLMEYIKELQKKASNKSTKFMQVLSRIETAIVNRNQASTLYDINNIDWNNHKSIKRFIKSDQTDINETDINNRHILTILINMYSEYLNQNNTTYSSIEQLIINIFSNYKILLDNQNITEIKNIIDEMIKKYKNKGIKQIQGFIRKQIFERILFNEDSFHSMEKTIDFSDLSFCEDIFNRAYSAINCIIESDSENIAKESLPYQYKLIYRASVILEYLINNNSINAKNFVFEIEKVLEKIDTIKNNNINSVKLVDYNNFLDDIHKLLIELHQKFKKVRLQRKITKLETKYSDILPPKYSMEIIQGIILPTEYSNIDSNNQNIITIDSEVSPDLDDAISLTIDKDGYYILDVHISNVGKILMINPILISEALKRCSSIYLSDNFIIHMLPDILSTNLCSLITGQPRDVITHRFKIKKDGIVEQFTPFLNTIRVSKRFSYKDVDRILKNQISDKKYEPMLKSLYELSQILQNRAKRNNEFTDQMINKDSVYESHRIIEETAILTNCHNAELATIEQDKYPFIYRIHSKDSNAIYSRESGFHYGLNKFYYTHSTSPIRRIIDALLQMILIDLKFNRSPQYKTYCEWENFIAKNLSSINEQTNTIRENSKKYYLKTNMINRYISSDI